MARMMSRLKEWGSAAQRKAVEKFVDGIFRYSKTTMALSVLVTLGLGSGLYFRRRETDMHVLYTIAGTDPVVRRQYYESHYEVSRPVFVMVECKERQGCLGKQNMMALYELDQQIQSIRVDMPRQFEVVEGGSEGEGAGLADLCYTRNGKDCQWTRPFELWKEAGEWGSPLKTLKGEYCLNVADNYYAALDSYFVGAEVDEEGKLVNCAVMLLKYNLRGVERLVPAAKEFELMAMKKIEEWKAVHEEFEVAYMTADSVGNELQRATSLGFWEIMRIVLMAVIMTLYAILVTFRRNYHNKAGLGAVGIGISALAYVGGTGLCSYLGVKHTPPCEATPFLVMAIGVDDVFVLLNSFNLCYSSKCPKERVRKSFAESFHSITVTTLTNFVAFMLGYWSQFYSISMFCVTTAVCLAYAYLLSVTLFVAMLCVEARRESRLDAQHGVVKLNLADEFAVVHHIWAESRSGDGRGCLVDPMYNLDSGARRALAWAVPRLASSWVFSGLMAVLTLLFLCFGAYGCTRVRSGMEFRTITPSDSYLRGFYDMCERHGWKYGEEVTVYFPSTAAFGESEVQERFLKLDEELRECEGLVEVTNGMAEFLRDMRGQSGQALRDAGSIQQGLRFWLQTPKGRAFEHQFKEMMGGKGSYFYTGHLQWTEETAELYKYFREVRDVMDRFTTAFGPTAPGEEPYVTAANADLWEVEPYMVGITLQNLLGATAAVMLVAALFMRDLICMLVLIFASLAVDLGLFGLLPAFSLELNMTTMINLIISIAYSVDYSVHIVHKYRQICRRNGVRGADAVAQTMIGMWAPVTHGMVTSALAVMCLAFNRKYVLNVFFIMIESVLVMAYALGALWIPWFYLIVERVRRSSGKQTKLEPAVLCADLQLESKR